MLFIQVFCVFTFLVFCLDFYLYNRESLKTKIITVEFFGFYSIFFVCSFFPCLGQHTPSACLFSFFSVRVFGVDGCVCVCAPTLPNICSCPNAILLWRCFVFFLFTTGIFMCVCVSVLLFMSFFFIVSANKLGKQENTRTIKQPINGLWQKRKANWHWHTSNCQTIQSEIVYRKRMNQI